MQYWNRESDPGKINTGLDRFEINKTFITFILEAI